MKTKFTHWTHFLDEAGTIKRQGDDQESRLRQIDRMKKEIKEMEAEYDKEEKSITELAAKDWTKEEIEKAKQDVHNPNHYVNRI